MNRCKGKSSVVCVCLFVCAVMCFLLTVGMFLTVFREYSLTKNFEESRCDVMSKTNHGLVDCRYCPSHGACYLSRFPCIQLHANYSTQGGTNAKGTLYSSTGAMQQFTTCSRSVCSRSESYNKDEVDKFVDQWFERQQVRCHYNTLNLKQVLTSVHFTRADALRSVLVPACLAFLMVILLMLNVMMFNKSPEARRRRGPVSPRSAQRGRTSERRNSLPVAQIMQPPSYEEITSSSAELQQWNQESGDGGLGNPVGPPPSYDESLNDLVEETSFVNISETTGSGVRESDTTT